MTIGGISGSDGPLDFANLNGDWHFTVPDACAPSRWRSEIRDGYYWDIVTDGDNNLTQLAGWHTSLDNNALAYTGDLVGPVFTGPVELPFDGAAEALDTYPDTATIVPSLWCTMPPADELTTEAGEPITDEGGDPLQVQ